MDDRSLESRNGSGRPQFPPLANLDKLLQNPNSSSFPTLVFIGNLNRALSKKSANEVWKENYHHDHVTAAANKSFRQRLIRASVINLGNQNGMMNAQPIMGIDPMVMRLQPADWFQFQVAAVHQRMTMINPNFKVAVQRDNFIFALNTVYDNSAVNNLDYSENQVSMSMLVLAISTSLSESHATSKRKRHFSDIMKEKTIEMRQKWMIKNRESAARSRAYTNHLEHEVFQSRKMNREKMIISSNPISMPKYRLRRTNSAPY
ncbi:ABSCISIC ACID-INSENSITIVE 5-like protein 3 [Pyrus ussuriensis x Pyrus communis]|uniref:ABSCISIC ACID-INSENSITIVE 5-like protein 3 n=1 Tax=Pyrus ussuriensis x Pyrus communis TaxID=2448454 RepID=A0A5N5GU58_9ROSA|nr:ABSCISIC ACID-INSENSITIVE 5-like protein 3 [Pyrus ussuriensis x Pyrus communis]